MREVRERLEGVLLRHATGKQARYGRHRVVHVVARAHVGLHHVLLPVDAQRERAALLAAVGDGRAGDVGGMMRATAVGAGIVAQVGKGAVAKGQLGAAVHTLHVRVLVGHALLVHRALHAKPHHLVVHGLGDGGRHLAVGVQHEHRLGRALGRLHDVVARSGPAGVAVHLIAVEVGDHHHLRANGGQHVLAATLVALDDGPVALAPAAHGAVEAERRGDALLEVGGRGVVGGGAVGVDDGLLHDVGRGGLAVGTGDDNGLVAARELGDDVGVDLERDHAGQRAARAPQQAHGAVGGLADRDGGT